MSCNGKQITIVTTFSKQGWYLYAQRFCTQLARFAVENISLVAYVEHDCELPERFVARSLFKVPNWIKFDREWGSNPIANGTAPQRIWTQKDLLQRYCYRHDARKFSRKVFAVEHASDQLQSGKLFWIDADVIVFASLSEEFFNKVLPDDRGLSFLHRPHSYTECGFVGYNLNMPKVREFIREFSRTFHDGEFIKHREWHDSWIFDRVRERFALPEFHIPSTHKWHPFDNSMLAKRMRHLKGKRKNYVKNK